MLVKPALTAAALILALVLAAGPAWPATEFHPRMRVEQEYNDNIFLLQDDVIASPVTTFYPGIEFSAQNPRGGAEIDYELGWSYYWDIEDDFVRHTANARAWQILTERLSIQATDQLFRSEELVEPGTATPTLGVRTALLPYLRNILNPQLVYATGPESQLTLDYTNILLDNEDPAVQDSLGNRGGFIWRQAFGATNVVDLGYSFERGDFDPPERGNRFLVIPDIQVHRANGGYTHRLNRHFSLLAIYNFEDLKFFGDLPGYRTHEPRAGVSYEWQGGWKAVVSAGYYMLEFKDGGGFGGLGADVLLQKVWPTAVAALSFTRGLDEDLYSAENLAVFSYWQSAANFTYFLEEHLSARLNAQFGTRRFQLVARKDDYWSLQAGLDYWLRRWLQVGIAYDRYTLETIPGPFNFSNNRYIASIGVIY